MISSHTNTFCVIGDPVRHSLSPLMHNAAFKETGTDGVYLAFEVKDISAAIYGIRGLGILGVSVTIPHKVSVIPHLDEIDKTARQIGAVNTIVNDRGKLRGYNTDCFGASKALAEKTEVQGKRVLIVGAGGAARAIGFGIAEKGGIITISNRTEEKGRSLAHDLQASFCGLEDLESKDWDIIINATSVGMAPKIEGCPVPESILQPGRVVMDIVYNPQETLLLKKAAQRGCETVDGVSMFVYQGACQFELWTGRDAPVSAMEKTVRRALSL